MGDKDPSPFGYTFTGSFFDNETPYDAGQPLLTDVESQSIADFFTNTDPFHLSESHTFPPAATDHKDSLDEFSSWTNFLSPATVHGVSTTIPDQTHLHNNFFNDHTYAQPPLPVNHLGNTQDDLQAASTLFQNSQSNYADNGTHSLHAVPTSNRHPSRNSSSSIDRNGKPMVNTQHGLLNEQLAALIPNHSEEGTLDAQLAAQWAASNAHQRHEAEFGDLVPRSNLKRAYTFGTDDSFNNPAGYSAPPNQEDADQVTRRLIRDLRHVQPLLRTGDLGGGDVNSTAHIHLPLSLTNDESDDEQSEEGSSEEEEDDKPAKKRRKSKLGKEGTRKGARNGKSRKVSAVDESSKKKRGSAAQKLQRENLTEEQKRSNHILSEQKRRNLIKRGFDDLHDLVPEIRNGGLSKSSVLTEAGNFLEKLIEENNKFRQLTGG